jgi:hypothetical protein
MTGKAAGSDHIYAKEFITLFKAFTVEWGYTLKQIFDLNETSVF